MPAPDAVIAAAGSAAPAVVDVEPVAGVIEAALPMPPCADVVVEAADDVSCGEPRRHTN
jgi:hypothetical protein